MNQYFLKLTKEEKENILDKHKSLYDGYATKNINSNLQPLYTQDLANDKNGITVNSKGEVSQYNNKLYIKESKSVCNECGGMMKEGKCNECDMKEGTKKLCKECGGMMKEGKCSECEVGEGIYDVEDLSGKADYTESDVNESIWSGIMDRIGFSNKVSKKPYTAEAVKKIISNIKKAKTEDQLQSAMNMYYNLLDTNSGEVNKAYIERIMTAYKRKADELENYLSKQDINSIMSDVENDVEFEQDIDDIKESIQESLKWFDKFKKYN